MSMLKKPEGSTRRRKRVGRGQGSGLGLTAGRGDNGQNARSGGGVRPGFEGGQMPLYRRIARRGFSNYPFKTKVAVLNLDALQQNYKSGETVSLESLAKKGLIKSREKNVKILGNGEIKKKLSVEYIAVSESAKAKIEKAGGTVTELKVLDTQEQNDGE
ncbi:50S ribosomal protein L15 [Salinispira pacifica]|uniref:Large ribosomal subunit protein uL15 n=1 Tax=Salinispira pacifica TaxID=1307761 RepID=V5WF99_9SPIO|nr:50S ribosomal protein L15 [Salinispira pacifica]AHC14315.1 LSU ribosomal protein L15p (L27Ae) [Salinispira pacifica]